MSDSAGARQGIRNYVSGPVKREREKKHFLFLLPFSTYFFFSGSPVFLPLSGNIQSNKLKQAVTERA